jgi:phage terminase small subunit
MARKLTPKQQKVVDQLLLDPSLKRCSEVTGASYDYVRELHTKTHILEILDERRQKVSETAEIDAAWVLREQRKIFERCMQDVQPIMARGPNGKMIETGVFKFDAAGANRALENIGKHRAVNAFKDAVDLNLTANTGIDKLFASIAAEAALLPCERK